MQWDIGLRVAYTIGFGTERPDRRHRRRRDDRDGRSGGGMAGASAAGAGEQALPTAVLRRRAERDEPRQLHRLQRRDHLAVLPIADQRHESAQSRNRHPLRVLGEHGEELENTEKSVRRRARPRLRPAPTTETSGRWGSGMLAPCRRAIVSARAMARPRRSFAAGRNRRLRAFAFPTARSARRPAAAGRAVRRQGTRRPVGLTSCRPTGSGPMAASAKSRRREGAFRARVRRHVWFPSRVGRGRCAAG